MSGEGSDVDETTGSEIRSRFGVYELVRKLGRGGMAETFEAMRRGHGGVVQRVCVKRILPFFDADSEFVELFLREARISTTLRHANVAQVLDFGQEEGRHYLVLELVDGVDLRGLLRDGERLAGGILAYLAVQLAQALDYAHAARPDGAVEGVVHRDISPSNVLLSPTGDVKLTDFGVAKAMNSPSLTRTGAVKGKIPYMAPEYARGGEYDARSDLFSLGVMLYECVAGRRPFDGASEVETLERVHSGRHVPLGDLAPSDVAPALVDAIEALISRDPADRPTTAAELLERLEHATPPPSARLALGRRVAEAKRKAGAARDSIGLDATARATPEGTAVVDAGGPKAWVLDGAAPDAETRTRLPEALPTAAEEARMESHTEPTKSAPEQDAESPMTATSRPRRASEPLAPKHDVLEAPPASSSSVAPEHDPPEDLEPADPLAETARTELPAKRPTRGTGGTGRRLALISLALLFASLVGVGIWLLMGSKP